MNCRNAQVLVTLRDGEDTTPREREDLERHLASCSACRAVRSSWQPLSLSHIRSVPPLTDDDYDSVRRSVMSRVGTSPLPARAGIQIRMAAVGALVIVVALIGFRFDRTVEPPTASTPSDVVAVADPTDLGATAVARFGESVGREEVSTSIPEKGASKPLNELAETSAESVVSAPAAVEQNRAVRIEMHTSNPNIRIIWVKSSQTSNESSDAVDATSDV